MTRTSAVRRRPSALVPSAPAGGPVGDVPATKTKAAEKPPLAPPRPAAVDLAQPPDTEVTVEETRRRGRGATSNASGRYEPQARVSFDDGWQNLEDLPAFHTSVSVDATRKIITRNE